MDIHVDFVGPLLLAAFLGGFTIFPVIFIGIMADKAERARGKPPMWFMIAALVFLGTLLAMLLTPIVPPLIRLSAMVYGGVFVGALFFHSAVKLAPKIYWGLRFFIWKLTGLWPNRRQ